MNNPTLPNPTTSRITIHEALTEQETAFFQAELSRYQERDLFPHMEEEDREYFRGSEYREEIQRLHDRGRNRCYYLLFVREGETIGLAMPVL